MIELTATAPETALPEAPPPPVAIREKGYAYEGDNGFWVDLTKEETPELRWPDSVLVFDRMRRQDAQVSSVLRAVQSPILRTGWSIEKADASDEITEFVASNLGLAIAGTDPVEQHTEQLRGRDRFSWNSHLRLALTFLPFGHAFFEQQYRYDDSGPRLSNGRTPARIRKLAFRPQRTLAQVNVARDGGLVSIEQIPAGGTSWIGGTNFLGSPGTFTLGGNEPPIPVNRLIAYTLDREGGNWLGVSLLRAAYKNWILKDRALRIWLMAIERNGIGVPIYIGADGEVSLESGKKLAMSIRAGKDSGAAIPNGAQLLLQGVNGSTIDIGAFVKYQDEQIARAVLAHFLNLGSQTGSWALGTTFADFFTLSLQSIAEELRDIATSHIVEDLVDINFGRNVPAPRIRFEEIGSRSIPNDDLADLRQRAGLEDDNDMAAFIRTHAGAEAA